MFLMDRFFDGTFLTFGIEVISFAERDQEDRIDPMVMIKIFLYLRPEKPTRADGWFLPE